MCRKAKSYCQDYTIAYCDTLLNSSVKLCNSCCKRAYCHRQRRFYNAKKAHQAYQRLLSSSRDGFDLTAQQFNDINDIVSPLVRRGQSIYHIVRTNRSSLPVSESTIRRLISSCETDVRLIDLPEAVKRRPRKKPRTLPKAAPLSKDGHLYSDFIEFISSNDLPIVQMDCLEGIKDDDEALLTLHFKNLHMQLVYILNKHDSKNVVSMLDSIELSLGKELFASCFPLILTDNGHEFSNITGIERSLFGGQRTHVFFCEPNRPDEKAECETNHRLIRRIIPKGMSLHSFIQSDMVLLTNHLNSYIRKSTFGKSPYDIAMSALPEDFFVLLGLEKIPPNEVMLKPSLLSK